MKKVAYLTYAKNNKTLGYKMIIVLKIPHEMEIYCFCNNNICAILLTLIVG